MKQKLLTLFVSLHKDPDKTKVTLDSISKQNNRNWHCIIIDDGTTVDSLPLAKLLMKSDSRFTLLNCNPYQLRKNSGAYRNLGLEHTKTKFVMCIEAGDYLHQDSLAHRINTLTANSDLNLYIFKTALVDKSQKIIGHFYNPNENRQDILYRLIDQKQPWHPISIIWETAFLRKIGGWNEAYTQLQDLELNLRSFLTIPKVHFSYGTEDSYVDSLKIKEQKSSNQLELAKLADDYHILLMRDHTIDSFFKTKISESFHRLLDTPWLIHNEFNYNQDNQKEYLTDVFYRRSS